MIKLKTLIKEEDELKSISAITDDVKKSMASYAQKEYDSWEQDEEGFDEELGSGGICHLIADQLADVLISNGIECQTVSSQHEQHVYLVGKFKEGVFEIDIPYHTYETGGGYSWKKIKDVKFDESYISIYKLDSDPHNFFKYVESDMMEIKHELEEDEHTSDTSWQETWKDFSGKVNYIGDCVSVLDQENNPFSGEATNMQQAVDNSVSIDYNKFMKKVNFGTSPRVLKMGLRKKTDKFQFGKYKDLIWAWDTEKDIHYFFL